MYQTQVYGKTPTRRRLRGGFSTQAATATIQVIARANDPEQAAEIARDVFEETITEKAAKVIVYELKEPEYGKVGAIVPIKPELTFKFVRGKAVAVEQ